MRPTLINREKHFLKYINAGLEFYEGAEMAADSLGKKKCHLICLSTIHVLQNLRLTKWLKEDR